jgi:hypothetical protein
LHAFCSRDCGSVGTDNLSQQKITQQIQIELALQFKFQKFSTFVASRLKTLRAAMKEMLK